MAFGKFGGPGGRSSPGGDRSRMPAQFSAALRIFSKE